MRVVSYISRGALSVALSDRPTTPKTLSTSGNDRRIRSCSCRSCEAWVIPIPGREVGMYNDDPSYNGGMNWLPNLNISGNVTTRKSRFSKSVVLRYFKQRRRMGRYRACVKREIGFADSGLSLPLMKITINTGTSVIASNDENPTAKVLVQASGLNIRPSLGSSRKTGMKHTTMISNETDKGGP